MFMKQETDSISQSKVSTGEVAKMFSKHKEDYHNSVGYVYWKETDASVSSKMTLKGTQSHMISFVSNDYLGLSQHSLVRSDAIRAINQFGTGFCAAPSIGGYSSLQKRLEDGLSSLLKTEDTLIFNSGFSTNIGVLSALVRSEDIVFLDKAVHRSVFDAIKHCTCKMLPHNDPSSLDLALQRYKEDGRNLFVVIDGVYSQDGDRGLIKEYLEITEKHDALLIVDDAHGIGVLGETGAGLLEVDGLLGKVPLVTGTLSKSFGSIGGYVSGRKELIDYIRYYAGSCCFSVSLPPPCLAASLRSLELIQKCLSERQQLLSKAEYAREKLRDAGFAITNSSSPIIGILTPSYDDAVLWAERLLKHNIYIVPIGYPIVPKGIPRLRLVLSSLHSYRDIDFLVSKLKLVSKDNYKENMSNKKRRSSAEIAQMIDKVTEDIVREKGFGGLSIQEVCERAKIEPSVFYRRYPEGFAFYVEAFIRNHDFWLTHYEDFRLEEMLGTPEELVQLLMSVWERVATDKLFESLLRLELQDSPLEASVEIAREREDKTRDLVEFFTQNALSPEILKIQLAIITAGLQYLVLHRDVSTFCGIDFRNVSSDSIKEALMLLLKTDK